MAGSSVHLGLLGPARRAGPSPLRSARKRRRGQGGRAPGPRPASTCHRALRPAWRLHSSSWCPQHLGGRAPGPRPASFCHRALRPAWRLHSSSRCPLRLGGRAPRLAARFYLQPGATARVASSHFKPVPAAPGGTCPPGSRPAPTCHRALRAGRSLHPSKLAPARLGGHAPPAAGPRLPPTVRWPAVRSVTTLPAVSWSHR